MRTAYAEWNYDYGRDGGGWWRYGTANDGVVFVPKDATPGSLADRCGYVYADDAGDAMRIDAEVFGAAA